MLTHPSSSDLLLNNKDIANKFNEFFVNIGSKLANSIKSNMNDIPYTSYLKK